MLVVGSSSALAQEYKEVYNEALAAAGAKKYTEAYQKYERAAELAKAAGDDEVSSLSLKVLAQLDKIFGSRDYKKGDYEAALTSFNKGIAHNPSYMPNYYNKGLALKKLDRIDEAMAALKIAADGNDRKVAREADDAIRSHYHAEASRLLAKANPTSADADRALAQLAEMESFTSPDADTYYYIATAYSAKGDYAQAVSMADEALKIHRGGRSDKAKIHFLKGEALMYAGDNDAAKAEFANAEYGQYAQSARHYIENL
jgi:tetratricopeptide (TPR) repeat protein